MKPDSRLYLLPSLAGIVSLGAPFVANITPWEALRQMDLWFLAAPFFLAPLAGVLLLRLHDKRPLGPSVHLGVYTLALAMAACTAWSAVSVALDTGASERGLRFWVVMAIPVLVPALAVWIVARNNNDNVPWMHLSPVLALEMSWIANGLFCLGLFADGWQLGAWLTVVAAAGYMLHVAHVAGLANVRHTGAADTAGAWL